MFVLKCICFVLLPVLITAQDGVIPPPQAAAIATPPNEVDFKRLFTEVEGQRQILDQITRTLHPIAEALRKLDSESTKSHETFQTISSLTENIQKIETLIEQVPKKVTEAAASTSKKDDFHESLTSQLNSLQISLVNNHQTAVDDLRSRLTEISEHTKGLEQLTKAQKNNAKQADLLEKIISNQDAILKNQNKIIAKLDRTLVDTLELYYEKLRNWTHEVIQFISDGVSGKRGTAGASLKKRATTFLSQLGASAAKASSQGQALVVKYHDELSNHLKQFGIPEPYHVYAATAILTIPLSLFALLIVSLTFRVLRILGSIIFYPLYCCFRRRSKPVEDGESKKRKSSEVDRDATTGKPPGKKQNVQRRSS